MSFNSKINLVSAKEFIGEFLLDFDINSSNYIASLNRHIIRGIELMDIDVFYRRCLKVSLIESGKVVLPCNSKFVEQVILGVGSCPYILDMKDNGLQLVSGQDSIGTSNIGYAEGRVLNLKRETGLVGIVFKSLPMNKEGYVEIPDDAWLKEALLYFLIYKMSLSGYKHKVISRQEAESKWDRMYPRARNSVTFPTVADIDRYTENVTSPLFNNIEREGGGFDSHRPTAITDLFLNGLNSFNRNELIEEIEDKIREYGHGSDHEHILFETLQSLPNN